MATTGRTVTPRLYIDWGGGFVDETAYLVTARGEYKIAAPGSAIMSPRGIVNSMSLTLLNEKDASTGRRFSPLNTAGPLYAYIQGGGAYHRPVQFDVKIDSGSWVRVFTGVIKIPREGVPTPKGESTITIECRTVDEQLLNLKISTSQAKLVANNSDGVTEADIITQWLDHYQVAWPVDKREIDTGLFVIPWAWLDDESALEEIWTLAAACGGRVYATQTGAIAFENMAHWLTHDTPIETLTRDDYRDLKIRYEDTDLFSEVTVEASPRAPDDATVLWEPENEEQVPAGGTVTITARLKYPAYAISGISFEGVTLGGTNITSDITCTHVDYAQRVELTFVNANATYAARLYKLQINGQPVVGAPILEEKRTSTAPFWANRIKRNRSVRSNVYVQTRAHAAAIAEFLRDTHQAPTLVYNLTGVQGKGLRTLGERIRILDSEVMTGTYASGRDAFITGLQWSFSPQGFWQDVEAIDAAGLYQYTLAQYFIIGSDTLGSSKRVFY
jgi:hypothetical protein